MSDCITKLTYKQIKRLKRMYTTEPAKVARRAHMVLLRNQGFTMEQIAEICLCNRETVSNALQSFKKHGYAGLYDKKHSGCPRSLNEQDEEYLLKALEQNPHEFGYFATVWTIQLMLEFLKDQRGKSVSKTVVKSVLARHNWHYNRPKHIPPTACPLEPAEKDCIMRLLTNPAPNEVLLFGDEADFEWLPYLAGAWMPQGRQLQIPTPGHNKVLCCFGFFNPHNCEFFYKLVRTRHKKTAQNFIAMLHQLRAQFPGKTLHLVVDNASIHDSRTKLLKAFRQTYGTQIIFHFLPKRSPILNPIERFWRFLKMRICANWLYDSLDSLADAFRSFVWHYREHKVIYNFSLANLISIWKKHPTTEQVQTAA